MDSFILIPARGGSKGIKNKNLVEFDGKPLIANTIIKALKSNFKRVIVATDSKQIKKVAIEYGAECPFLRPKEISRDNSHAFAVYKYTCNWLKKNEGKCPEIMSVLLCTTPFTPLLKINEGLKKLKSKKYDWVFGITECEHHPHRVMKKNKDLLKPLFDLDNKILWENRQKMSKFYRFNGTFIGCLTKNIFENKQYNVDNKKFKNTKVGFVELKKSLSIDIDDQYDLEVSKFINSKLL